MADTTAYNEEYGSKFIFTDEGRRLLTAQENGIRFAVLGAVLIQGLKPVDVDSLYETYRTITLDQLKADNNIVFGLKDVSYKSRGNQRVEAYNTEQYNNVVNELEKHLIDLFYIPTHEMKDANGNCYGTYEMEIDRTTIAWDMQDDISFGHIALIGKMYAETNDAVFNVDNTQAPVIVGLVQLDSEYDQETNTLIGGIQLLAEQNKYVGLRLQIRFTLTDTDHDTTQLLTSDKESKEFLDVSEHLHLVNNGLKTNSNVNKTKSNVIITNDKEFVEEMSLNEDGSLASPRSLMVADEYDADLVENQWNAAGLVHIINKKDEINEYKEQIIFTTLEQPEDYVVDKLTAYNVGMILKGSGKYVEHEILEDMLNQSPASISIMSTTGTTGTCVSGIESPIFKLAGVPEYDTYAVDIFGQENDFLGLGNGDKSIFSKNNGIGDPVDISEFGYNVFIHSNDNILKEDGANTNNTLVKSNYNLITQKSNSNLLIGADANQLLNETNTNTIIVSDYNKLEGANTYSNIIFGGSSNYINNSEKVIMLGGLGLNAENAKDQIILGKYNAPSNATVVFGYGQDENNRANALEFYPEEGRLSLFNDGVKVVELGPDGVQASSLDIDNISTKSIETDELKANTISATKDISVGNELKVDSHGITIPESGRIRFGINSTGFITADTLLLARSNDAENRVTLNSQGLFIKNKTYGRSLNISVVEGVISTTNAAGQTKIMSNTSVFEADIYTYFTEGVADDALHTTFDVKTIVRNDPANASNWFTKAMETLSIGYTSSESTKPDDAACYKNGSGLCSNTSTGGYVTSTLPEPGSNDNISWDFSDSTKPVVIIKVPTLYDSIKLTIYEQSVYDYNLILPFIFVTEATATEPSKQIPVEITVIPHAFSDKTIDNKCYYWNKGKMSIDGTQATTESIMAAPPVTYGVLLTSRTYRLDNPEGIPQFFGWHGLPYYL